MNRFDVFTDEERGAIRDGLLTEAGLDPNEDPLFVVRVVVAGALLEELKSAVWTPWLTLD